MEPDVIRMYSSSPPPMEDGAEEEEDEFGDFGTFSAVPSSISFTEFDTPTTFNQGQALAATSPPELVGGRAVVGRANGTHCPAYSSHGPAHEPSKANGQLSGGLADRTEDRKVPCILPDLPAGDCNGGVVLTNGFAGLQGSPPPQSPAHFHIKGLSTGDGSPEDEFADFAAFSSTYGRTADEDSDNPATDQHHRHDDRHDEHGDRHGEHHHKEQGTSSGDAIRDTNGSPAEPSTDATQRDAAHPASEAVCTKDLAATLNGADAADEDAGGCSDSELSPEGSDETPCLDGKNSGNDTETETETSLGRPLSTDALEEYGDVSTTGSAPSPPPQDMATPPEHSQLAEDDEDFGEFGDAGSFGCPGFADFEVQQEPNDPPSSAPQQQDADFGDFNSPKFEDVAAEGAEPARFADFPVSDSFGNFSSAVDGGGEADTGWSSFGEQQQQEAGGEEWAAFGSDQSAAMTAPPAGGEDEWHESEAAEFSEDSSKVEPQTAEPSSRLERLFQCSFPQSSAPPVKEPVASLRTLVEGEGRSLGNRRGSVWLQLQDIHEAFGLRHQWGGSYCNKALLCCLGIDTRNILFTGQKKQPVIVPMYAASLGMLEPTKEPVKPVSAAEMIASIAQAPPGAAEKSSCPTASVQEALPPVQFDWSSSGLTNPLDASGGSFLLNLDFFGPVEDSGSGCSHAIPGVDPELFELTTAKLEPGGSGSRVADAFARLMSTMEKTSTSTRKPRKDENLSEEAAKVISSLPDLTFMQAKVLMFPATLTPLGCQAMPD